MKMFLIVANVLIVSVIAAWNLNHISGTWHYKMTVTVETPEGIKTGYAVREVGNSASRHKIGGTPESTPRIHHKGEAVVVDLGARGKLFAILSGYRLGVDHSKLIFYYSFGGYTTFDGVKKLNSLPVGTKVTLPIKDYPVFVAFKDINDPKSVTPVLKIESVTQSGQDDFQITENHMEELFGKGVRLKDVAIEITDEKVTWGTVKTYLGPRHAVGPYEFIKGE
jgi:hypothetical protein